MTGLYAEHALGLTRLAFMMLGDRFAAEDVVQEAFCGLYRAWDRLPDHDNVVGYLRVSVLNGCRSALRRARRTPRIAHSPAAALCVHPPGPLRTCRMPLGAFNGYSRQLLVSYHGAGPGHPDYRCVGGRITRREHIG